MKYEAFAYPLKLSFWVDLCSDFGQKPDISIDFSCLVKKEGDVLVGRELAVGRFASDLYELKVSSQVKVSER